MSEDAVLMLIWRHNGETLVIPAVDAEGDDNALMRALVDKLPERVKGTAEAAVLRGIVADQRGMIGALTVRVRDASDRIAELEIENVQLRGLETYAIPVEAT